MLLCSPATLYDMENTDMQSYSCICWLYCDWGGHEVPDAPLPTRATSVPKVAIPPSFC